VAFPTIPTTGANTLIPSVQGTATTTHTFGSLTTLDNASGDLLIAVIVLYQASATGNAFSSWGGGFTEFGDSASAVNPSMAMGCAYKISNGTETGTFTVTSSISGRSAMFLMSVKNWHGTTVPEVAFSAETTATAQDPPNLDPAGWGAEDTLWIAVAAGGQTSLTGSWGGITSAPASYTDYAESTIAGGDVIGACQIAVAFRGNNVSAENPGSFTTDTSPEIERAATIAVRPKEVFNLVIADGAHAHAADNLTLTQVHVLTVADATHSHAADNLALTQVHSLTIVDASQAHAADNLVLVQVPTLIVADAVHGHTADNVVLEEQSGATDLVIADATHAHAADNVALTQAHNLAVADAAHSHVADATVLTQAHNLAIADATHAHAADNLALTQLHQLVIQDATQAQTADECQVNSATQLVIQDAGHSHAADALVLTQVHNLTVADALHGHTADGLNLTQLHELVIADAVQAQAVDNLNLGSSNEIDLFIDAARHQHTAGNLKLYTNLTPPPAVHARASTVIHAGGAGAAAAAHIAGIRPQVTQRSGAA
jgi:hypothetical protein